MGGRDTTRIGMLDARTRGYWLIPRTTDLNTVLLSYIPRDFKFDGNLSSSRITDFVG